MKKIAGPLIMLAGYFVFCLIQKVFAMQGEFYDMQAQYHPMIPVIRLLLCGGVMGFVTVKGSRAAEGLSGKISLLAVCAVIALVPPILYWSGVLIPYLLVEAARYYMIILGWYIIYLILSREKH